MRNISATVWTAVVTNPTSPKGWVIPAKIAKELLAETRIQAWRSPEKRRKSPDASFSPCWPSAASICSCRYRCWWSCAFSPHPTPCRWAFFCVGLLATASYLPGQDHFVHSARLGEGIHISQSQDGRKVEITKDMGHGINIHVDDAEEPGEVPVAGAETQSGLNIDLEELSWLSETEARAVAAVGGLMSGALLLLFNLWVTRLLVRGFVKYARLNYSILRGE